MAKYFQNGNEAKVNDLVMLYINLTPFFKLSSKILFVWSCDLSLMPYIVIIRKLSVLDQISCIFLSFYGISLIYCQENIFVLFGIICCSQDQNDYIRACFHLIEFI